MMGIMRSRRGGSRRSQGMTSLPPHTILIAFCTWRLDGELKWKTYSSLLHRHVSCRSPNRWIRIVVLGISDGHVPEVDVGASLKPRSMVAGTHSLAYDAGRGLIMDT